MRTACLAAAALLLPVGLTAAPAGAQVSDSLAGSAYQTYVACSTKNSAPQSHSCGKNQPKTAFFKSKDASVQYKICVKYPGGRKLCANRQDAPAGTKQSNSITSTSVGKHKVKWYVDGVKVGKFNFRVTAS